MMPLQVVYSGAYRCVCVQIKLHHMAVNATAQAGVVGELEGAALLDSTLDPQGAGQAFKVLKQLVSNWLADATQNNNRQAASVQAMSNMVLVCLITTTCGLVSCIAGQDVL